MAKQRKESGGKQNRGYDEAVGRDSVAGDRPDRMVPEKGDKTQRQNTTEDVDDGEAGREP